MLTNILLRPDIVIVATNAEQPVIMKADLENSNPKILIDLSIPNNIDPLAKELAHITLVNVDDLSKINDATLQKRQAEVPKAKAIIAEHIDEFTEWYGMRKNVPVLKAVKQKLQDMHECNLFMAMHPNLGESYTQHASSDSIQKVINNMAAKMRQQRKARVATI
jgi:glutamyl-tRNA reductase